MGEFRIGRSRAQHSYPEARRNTTVAFARNSASGPAANTPITTGAGIQVPWSVIESGAPASTDVPITPRVTGIIHITGVLTITNPDEADSIVQLQVEIGDVVVPIPLAENVSLNDSVIPVPFDVIVGAGANGPALPVGVVSLVQIRVKEGGESSISELVQASCTIHIQEVSAVTG